MKKARETATRWVDPEITMSAVNHLIGPALRIIRVGRKMTQEEVALAVGKLLRVAISQGYISRVESGKSHASSIKRGRLVAICYVLGCHLSFVESIVERLAKSRWKSDEELISEIQSRIEEHQTKLNGDSHSQSEYGRSRHKVCPR